MRPILLLPVLLALGAPAPGARGEAAPAARAGEPTPSIRDHERVRAAVARGDYVPLADIIADAQRRHPGRVLEVEFENEEYEIEILGEDGRILEFEYNARTGALNEIEVEDD